MENNSLKHYGVLGMKWGIRKYQNPDGTLTRAGKKRYGEDGQYEYKSHGTKRLERRVRKLNEKAEYEKANLGEVSQQTSAAIKRKLHNLEVSKMNDKNYLDYAKRTSTGKALLQNILMTPFGARGYQQARANGSGRLVAGILGISTAASPVGNMVARKVNREISDYKRNSYAYKEDMKQRLKEANGVA